MIPKKPKQANGVVVQLVGLEEREEELAVGVVAEAEAEGEDAPLLEGDNHCFRTSLNLRHSHSLSVVGHSKTCLRESIHGWIKSRLFCLWEVQSFFIEQFDGVFLCLVCVLVVIRLK